MSVIESMRGLSPQRLPNATRLCAKIASAAPLCLKGFSSNRPQQSIAAVLPLQLIHQVPEVRRQFGIFRAKVLLQPFADGTADRSAGGAIELFAAFVDSVEHREFRFALIAVD
jgi:hypothetical protein